MIAAALLALDATIAATVNQNQARTTLEELARQALLVVADETASK